jgi:ribosomal protein S18 acetylase RimI-like enzyme
MPVSAPPGLFVPIELAARIDKAEARLTADMAQGALARRPETAFVEAIGGGVAAFAGPSSHVNKMIGVGFDPLPSDEALARVEEKFRARQAPLQAEVSTLADAALAATLSRRGYVLQGFENVLGRRLGAADVQTPAGPAAFDVRVLEPRDFDAWIDVNIAGFGSPDIQGVPGEPQPSREVLEDALRELASAPDFRRYAAWVDGRMAGCARLRLDDGLAQLCGAATLPEFRRRGIQSAFLRRRLADAVAAGCDLALVTTQPGSKSQQNSQQQGFALLYSRAVLVKPPG